MNKVRNLAVLRLFLCCIAALSGGCSGSKVSQTNYDKIKEGMTEAEVQRILGPPSNTASSSISRTDPKTGTTEQSKSQMSWGDGDRSITIDFTNGKVAGKKQQGLEK